VLASIGGPAVSALVAFVQRTPDPRLRQFTIQTLRRYPNETRQALLDQLAGKQTPETLTRLLPLVALCPDASLAIPLAALLKSSDTPLRKEALRALASIKDDHTQQALIGALDTTDASIQAGIIKLIREEHLTAAVPELIRRMPHMSPVLQQEICQAFADLNDPAAIPVLIQTLDLQKMPWQKSTVPEALRIKAAWALGVFLNDPWVEKTLTSALKDKSLHVQAMARGMLEKSGKLKA